MSSNNVRKPLLYWVTLAIMVMAFACIAVTSAQERPGTVTHVDESGDVAGNPMALNKSAIDSDLYLEDIPSSNRGTP